MLLADLQDKYDQVHFADKENEIYRSNKSKGDQIKTFYFLFWAQCMASE